MLSVNNQYGDSFTVLVNHDQNGHDVLTLEMVLGDTLESVDLTKDEAKELADLILQTVNTKM